MSKILLRSSLRYIIDHPWQFFLSILGILLGVAVVISMDIANESARQAFITSTQTVTGKSTHQISGPPGGFSEDLYRELRIKKKIRPSAPVIEGFLALPEYKGQTLHLLGIEPLTDSSFRPYLNNFRNKTITNLFPLLSRPYTGMISTDKSLQLGIKTGDLLTVRAGSIKEKILIIGLIEPSDEMSRRALENMLITDIATAQELLAMKGHISWIDLIIPEGPQGKILIENIKKELPKENRLTPTNSRSQAVTNMTRAFNLNLTALSTLALIVGMFLIYNTMTFSVVQRRTMIGMLRAVGVTRGEIFRLILGEALFIGICGTITGIVTGIFMGKGMVTLVTNAINDIYFVLSVTNITISYLTILKAIGLGICATLIAALLPALEATSAPPRTVISRSTIEIGSRGRLLLEALAGLLLLICATGLIFFSERDLIFSIGSMFIITIGFALLTPIITVIFTGLLKPITGYLFGIPGRMSASGITSSLSRTAVAIAALMIALSVTVSVGIMVASLRYAVIVWMETFLKADIYISPPALVYSRSDLLIDPHLVKLLSEADGISSVTTYRGVMIESDRGLNQLIAITIDKETYSSFRFKEGNPANIWTVFEGQDSVIVSESYAYLHNSRIGSTITMLTNRGEKKFFIAGIFYDYTSDRGIIVINRKTYEKYWYDRNISSLAIYTKKGVNTDDLINKLREIAGPHQEIIIQSNRSLREVTLQVFDRTFIITDVLRILSIIVAFIGVLSALMALQLERAREIAVLRATGLTPGQVWKIIIIQTALMGIIAGVMALILGIVIAIVLIFVINRRSFGWTMEMVIPQAILVQSFFLAITASILAGIYPAMKMAGTSPAAALREE